MTDSTLLHLRLYTEQAESIHQASTAKKAVRPQDPYIARLEAVLRDGAKAMHCDVAVLYVLDDNTTELRLKAAWQLPEERYDAPARPLCNATADLEALCGHVIVLNEAERYREWNLPESYASAMCLPVSTSGEITGTVWFFAKQQREFHQAELGLGEIVAGRLANDIELHALTARTASNAQYAKQFESARLWQYNWLPRVAPHVDDWDVAGWTGEAGGVGGAFHDWCLGPHEQLMLAVGDCLNGGFDAALSASAARSAWRAHGQYNVAPEELLQRVNQTLWTGSAGDQFAALFTACIDPVTGEFTYAAAGDLGAVLLGSEISQPLAEPSIALGIDPEVRYERQQRQMRCGDVLVITSANLRDAMDAEGRPFGTTGLVECLRSHLDKPAGVLMDLVRQKAEQHSPGLVSLDRTVLVVKRCL